MYTTHLLNFMLPPWEMHEKYQYRKLHFISIQKKFCWLDLNESYRQLCIYITVKLLLYTPHSFFVVVKHINSLVLGAWTPNLKEENKDLSYLPCSVDDIWLPLWWQCCLKGHCQFKKEKKGKNYWPSDMSLVNSYSSSHFSFSITLWHK